MNCVRMVVVCWTLTCAAAGVAWADYRQDAAFMKIHGQALPPYGYVEFCKKFKNECLAPSRPVYARFNATPERLSELDATNRAVNARIQPATDQSLYGLEEYWTFPVSKGDCEDYVVLKRKMLMDLGWPPSALLITVVRDELGDGHAVLTVRTRQGDFVLDNKVDDVRLWSRTPYQYLMRQSYINPRIWMALDPGASSRQVPVAGVN